MRIKIPFEFSFSWVCLLLCIVGKVSSAPLSPYHKALSHYEARNYEAAAEAFQVLLPSIHGQEEEASIYFYLAYCKFYTKKYKKSASYFRYLYENFPEEANTEEAVYMWGHTLYLKSPDVRLDQSITREALQACNTYLALYPQGKYANKIHVKWKALHTKLAYQSLNHAKCYYALHKYKAAILCLARFQKDFPETCYSEEAAYLRISAQYLCYQDAISRAKHLRVDQNEEAYVSSRSMEGIEEEDADEFEDQLDVVIRDCQTFLATYPHGRYTRLVKRIHVLLLDSGKH